MEFATFSNDTHTSKCDKPKNAHHLEILISEQSWSIRHRTVTKICIHEILPSTVENSFQWLEWPLDQSSWQINQSHFLSLKLLQPASGKSSTWKTTQKQNKNPERFYRISCLKRILIYQLFTYHTVSIKLYHFKSAGRIIHHFISKKICKDC